METISLCNNANKMSHTHQHFPFYNPDFSLLYSTYLQHHKWQVHLKSSLNECYLKSTLMSKMGSFLLKKAWQYSRYIKKLENPRNAQ